MKPLDRIITKIRPKPDPAPRGETLVKPPPRLPEPQVTWKDCETFEEWVIRMVREGKTKDPSFQSAIDLWGRERLLKIWQGRKRTEGGDEG